MSTKYQLPRLISEPNEAYHARRSKYMSSHQLADFRRSPLLWKKKQAGLIPQYQSSAYTVGSAAHCLILEGEEVFNRRYLVGGPINPKTQRPYGKDTKAYSQWAAQQTKDVISDDDYALCVQMLGAVQSHEKSCELLSEGVPEAVVRADYCGTPSQVRFDWLSPLAGIVDLKTCRNLDEFEAVARSVVIDKDGVITEPPGSFGYLHQLAFYREILALKMDGLRVDCWFIAVEKQEPYRCGVWKCSDESLGAAMRENERALAHFLYCRDSNDWPTGYEEVRTL